MKLFLFALLAAGSLFGQGITFFSGSGLSLAGTYGYFNGGSGTVTSSATTSINVAAGTTVLVAAAQNNNAITGCTGTSGATFTGYPVSPYSSGGSLLQWWYHHYAGSASSEVITCTYASTGSTFNGLVAIQILGAAGTFDTAAYGGSNGTSSLATSVTFSTIHFSEVGCFMVDVGFSPVLTPGTMGGVATTNFYSDNANTAAIVAVQCVVFSALQTSIAGSFSWSPNHAWGGITGGIY